MSAIKKNIFDLTKNDLEELSGMVGDSIYITKKMLRASFRNAPELMKLLERALFLVNQELER